MPSNSVSLTSDIVFELREVSKKYDDLLVLDQISMQIRRGQWVGIIGESGSGKSTLLQIAAKLIDPEVGSVVLNKQELPLVGSQLIAGHPMLKIVHQEFDLFPNLTVWENIAYPIRLLPKKRIEARVDELIRAAGLEGVAHQKSKFLSGGEKQRTAICKALAELPVLLLLDETFAHLDGPNRSRLTRLFHRLKSAENQTCLFVTHSTREAMDWADHLIVLRKGKIIQVGTPLEVYNRPNCSYTAELTGIVNWISLQPKRMIRAEKVKVSRQKPRGFSLVATIDQVHFRGIHWAYTALTDGGEFWTVYRLRNDLKPGQKVYLRFIENDVIAVAN